MESIDTELGDILTTTENQNFSNHIITRLQPGADLDEAISAVTNLDSSISFVSPLLTREGRSGDIAILPRLIVRFKSPRKPGWLTSQAGYSGALRFRSKLKFTDQEFEYELTSPVDDIASIFETARQIAQIPDVEWAEPTMIVNPRKMFIPSDSLYPIQWHLNNIGQNGGVADADVNAPEGWDLSKGEGTVIAIFDDAVEVDHEDLPIWNNPGESGNGKETNNIDDDGNGYIDDFQGWDFADQDNDPSPPTGSNDNHGTAVAGVAGARGNNTIGVAGTAISTEILPIRWPGTASCTIWGNAMRYAAKYGDLVSNSWSIGGCENVLNSTISDAVNGQIPGARRGAKGTPILVATGNDASGWRKFTLNGFAGGQHTFKWEYNKDELTSEGYDTVWLDKISWPGGDTEDFETETEGNVPANFTSSGNAQWSVVSDDVHARGTTNGNSVKAGGISHSQTTSLETTRTVGSGGLTYWAWVSSEQNYDYFRFYVDGTEYHYFTPGQYGHQNEPSYPASNPDTIAIGASTDGGIDNIEERSSYSQFGIELDVVAPSSGGNQGITTTDRTGANGYSSNSYTTGFGGTSSATPAAAGVVADIISLHPSLTATEVRQALREGTDKIGPYAYLNNRNDFYGYGRINLLKTLQNLNDINLHRVIKRNEIAKALLLAKYGAGYPTPTFTGGVFTDISEEDYRSAWIEQLTTEGITEGCSDSKFCPDAAVTNEQVAKLLINAKDPSTCSSPTATGGVFTDVGANNFAACWIEQLSIQGISEGCGNGKFCPKQSVTWEGFEKMLGNAFP